MLVYSKLQVPSFDLTWFKTEGNCYCLVTGGGGSAKTGVRNQIQIFKYDDDINLKLHSYFETTVNELSRFCFGLYSGNCSGHSLLIGLLDYDFLLLENIGNSPDQPILLSTISVFRFSSNESISCGSIHGSGYILIGGEKSKISVWKVLESFDNRVNFAHHGDLLGHSAEITNLSPHPSLDIAISSSKDSTINIWNLVSCCLLVTLNPYTTLKSECRGCCFSQMGDYIFSIHNIGRDFSYLIKWKTSNDLEANSSVSKDRVKRLTKIPAVKVCLNDTCEYLALGFADGGLTVLRTSNFLQVYYKLCHQLPVTGVSFAPSEIADHYGVKCIVNSCSADSALTSIHINDNSIFSTGILVTLLSVIIVLSLCLQFDVLSTTLTLLKFKPLLLREL